MMKKGDDERQPRDVVAVRLAAAVALAFALALGSPGARAQQIVPLEAFHGLLDENAAAGQASLQRIRAGWRNEYASMMLELIGFVPSRETQLEVHPPLKNPKMIRARAASYLADDDIVFGVAIDGDVRAYPKRILAWHEMVKDTIAGRPLNGVYCTLCGAMILYDVTVDGVHHELGTSGFLYRSNKLMYDHASKSLWSTLTGTPVVGPLAGRGIELKLLHVVTTTWQEWNKRHPRTSGSRPGTANALHATARERPGRSARMGSAGPGARRSNGCPRTALSGSAGIPLFPKHC